MKKKLLIVMGLPILGGLAAGTVALSAGVANASTAPQTGTTTTQSAPAPTDSKVVAPPTEIVTPTKVEWNDQLTCLPKDSYVELPAGAAPLASCAPTN